MLLLLSLLDGGLEGRQPLGPEVVEVGAHGRKSVRVKCVQAARVIGGDGRQPRLLKSPEMMRGSLL